MKLTENKIAVYVEDEAVKNGIYVPEIHQEIGYVTGVVEYIGPGRFVPATGTILPPSVNVGDRVVFNNSAAAVINIGKKNSAGNIETKKYYVMADYEAIAALEENETVEN